jgi:hypothetical protein
MKVPLRIQGVYKMTQNKREQKDKRHKKITPTKTQPQ